MISWIIHAYNSKKIELVWITTDKENILHIHKGFYSGIKKEEALKFART